MGRFTSYGEYDGHHNIGTQTSSPEPDIVVGFECLVMTRKELFHFIRNNEIYVDPNSFKQIPEAGLSIISRACGQILLYASFGRKNESEQLLSELQNLVNTAVGSYAYESPIGEDYNGFTIREAGDVSKL